MILLAARTALAFQTAGRFHTLKRERLVTSEAKVTLGNDAHAEDRALGVSRREWSAAALLPITVGAFGLTAARAEEGIAAAESPPDSTPAPPPPLAEDFPADAKVPYKGKDLPLRKFRAKATVVVNVKTDDPEATKQYPALAYLNERHAAQGLRILAFPTEQGWFEPEVSDIVRLRALQMHGFGSFPTAVVFDKVDILGATAHPLYKYMMGHLKNPNGRAAVSLNFEKFLLDERGNVVRRYPRKYSGYQMEKDVEALLNGQELPPESDEFLVAWKEAERESIKSEYAFRLGYNLYVQDKRSTDWKGIGDEGFR